MTNEAKAKQAEELAATLYGLSLQLTMQRQVIRQAEEKAIKPQEAKDEIMHLCDTIDQAAAEATEAAAHLKEYAKAIRRQ